MKWLKGFICFTLLCVGVNVYSQFGVRIKHNRNFFNPDSEFFYFKDGFEFGIDYWLRLKDRRIEFLPEFSYEITDAIVSVQPADVSFKSFNFNFNTNIYPLDFFNDCDCPTFSKEGGTFDKGFHVIISPGLRYYNWDHEDIVTDRKIGLLAGLGAGLDIGVNNLITISPSVIYRLSFNQEVEFYSDIGAGSLIEDNNGQILLGIRIGFRPDYQTPRFRR